ncbi:two-component sensor histidine kinase [Paractinoplanes abujensis]|uniref:histidine kinase n=1 Tax=Paractinoplanes abujensis TaxID=882441 RepID=A0A7W7CSP1_9ACTN|nr:ATP-binding protein [Actinoplanes abujensis]MBB4693962.1 two-component system sensor histidine kinase BaeS [Actinoplanes abujensis]GID21381.1 two-component sensor histidine kinase [Actinoplanes abujensis]
MSFRIRIFALVMLVAVTAIGATAFLTLQLTQRQVSRAVESQNRYRAEIVEEIQRYGLAHGRWPGLDRLVTDLSDRTGLHIRVQTADEGIVLVDSDIQAKRASGPVQAIAYHIDALPPITVPLLLTEAEARRQISPATYRKMSLVPSNVFGATPTDPLFGTTAALVLRQAAQFRTGLVLVRCLNETLGDEPALGLPTAPYVTPEQLKRSPECTRRALTKVLSDEAWFYSYWDYYLQCAGVQKGDPEFLPERVRPGAETRPGAKQIATCVSQAYADTVVTSAAVPLELYLGGRDGVDLAEFGRPGIAGAAGLIVVALIGTFLIARQVSSPVRRLTGASQMLAAGQLDARVRIKGRGELARLGTSFNTMAQAVQQSEEQQRRLIADVAHEMRTPLSNLRGYLEGLSDGVIEPSRELFVSLHEETMLQGRILDDLQVLALAEAGDLGYTRQPIDLADLASGSVTAHRAVAAEAQVALTVDASAPVWVSADQDRIRQVLGNLLTNAIRYTDRTGQVLVRVRAEHGEGVLTVQDTGVGIAAGDLPHVFDRFWRADPARQRATGGTGLGLTIAHRIVTDHGGRIQVESRQHVGTTFTVRLPLTEPA